MLICKKNVVCSLNLRFCDWFQPFFSCIWWAETFFFRSGIKKVLSWLSSRQSQSFIVFSVRGKLSSHSSLFVKLLSSFFSFLVPFLLPRFWKHTIFRESIDFVDILRIANDFEVQFVVRRDPFPFVFFSIFAVSHKGVRDLTIRGSKIRCEPTYNIKIKKKILRPENGLRFQWLWTIFFWQWGIKKGWIDAFSFGVTKYSSAASFF